MLGSTNPCFGARRPFEATCPKYKQINAQALLLLLPPIVDWLKSSAKYHSITILFKFETKPRTLADEIRGGTVDGTLHVVDDVECGTLADGVGGGTLADGVGGGTLADDVGGGILADGAGGGTLADGVGGGTLADDVGGGILADGAGGGTLADGVGGGTLADGVGGGTLADGVGGGMLADDVGDGTLADDVRGGTEADDMGGTLATGIACMAGGTLGVAGATVLGTLDGPVVVGTLACADVCLFLRW